MPLLSVVIPTRNRNKYIIDSINVILNNVSDVEIIVSDNSDTNILSSMLAPHLKTGKLKYFYSSDNLSVVDNFERAFLEAKGDYLISIGDDDAVGPGLEAIAQWAKAKEIDAVVSYRDSFLAAYYWPGVKSKYFGNGYDSRLFIYEFTGEVKAIDPIKALRNVARRLGGGLGELPRAYHGLVSRTLVEKIRASNGHLFGGVSPDIYSAALIAGSCRQAILVDFPFVIPGASAASAAGNGVNRSDRGTIQGTEHTARFGEKLIWDYRIPQFYSPHTVWAYSLCMALKRLPNLKISPEFSRLYACCFLYSRRNHYELFRAMRFLAKTEGRFSVLIKFSVSLILELSRLSWKLLTRLSSLRAGGRAVSYGPLDSISQAFIQLNKHIAQGKIKLKL
ncbi:MAG: glycosyltransferase [Serpentinimonas sp.]|nr:glycosyltransferase [Serpentinimonas sp.]